MNIKNFETYFDCGFSKIRAGAFSKNKSSEVFHTESIFLVDHIDLNSEIEKLITSIEKNTNEYIEEVNLMIDSLEMLSIGVSVSKKLDGSKLKQDDVQFLIQQAKQQIIEYYKDQNIVHIIVNNYKIDNNDHTFLPAEINCNLISLDIFFICIPNKIVNYYKKSFHKLDISINQVVCSSYVKSVNYKENFFPNDDIAFVDVGFNKTSIICYTKNKITSLSVLPVGGNHITKDISKLLKVDLKKAENIKLEFDNSQSYIINDDFSLDFLQKIVFARTEEILELCAKNIKLNLTILDKFKMVLMGEGSKILDNQYKDKISFSNDIDFLEETTEAICQSGFKLGMGLNKSEVLIIPKKQIKKGFFEKLFHFFR